MNMGFPTNNSDVILGRPFLSTIRALIDVYHGCISLEYCGQTIKFDMYDAMKHPSEIHNLNFMDVYEPPDNVVFELNETNPLNYVLTRGMEGDKLDVMKEKLVISDDLLETVEELKAIGTVDEGETNSELPQAYNKLLPSIMQAPKI